MPKKLTKWIIASLVLTGLGIMFSGCATGVLRETSVRSLPREIEANISIGNTRQEVRSLLGKPFIDVRSLGLEANRRTGRDFKFVWII